MLQLHEVVHYGPPCQTNGLPLVNVLQPKLSIWIFCLVDQQLSFSLQAGLFFVHAGNGFKSSQVCCTYFSIEMIDVDMVRYIKLPFPQSFQ